MKSLLIFLLFIFKYECKAQELFVFSEPASNMPAKSIGLDVTAKFPDSKFDGHFRHRYIPEVMVGVNKKLMVNASSSFSNYYGLNTLLFDGARVYARYRFLSNDDVHKHFRMAAFAEAGFSTHTYIYDETGLQGDNNGVQTGLIATQLINRFAVSATASYMRIFMKDKAEPQNMLNRSSHMFSYSLSGGYLLLPKEYVDYKQINVNLYLELLGSNCLDSDCYMVDLAPAVQLIFNSNTKISIGAAFQLQSNMLRVGQRTFKIGLEKTILNAWK